MQCILVHVGTALLTVLHCCRSVEVSIPEAEYEVARGGEIILTCSFTPARPELTMFVLTWEAYPDNDGGPLKSVATYFMNNPIDIAPGYEGRAFLEVDIEKQVSTLRLTKVTMQDNRRFQCSVKIPNDDEGTTAVTTSLLVLVPPSAPICRLQGAAEYFQNITLTCMSEEGSPSPVYKWESYSVENLPRQLPPRASQKDGALSLLNITRETSGFFICTSSNRIDSLSCNFTLSVMPGSMNTGATAIIIGGVLAGLLFVGVLIFYCYRKKAKKAKQAEGTPGEEVFYDREGPEAGEQYRDDSEKKQVNQDEDKDIVPHNNYGKVAAGQQFDGDQHSHKSGKERYNGGGSDTESQHHRNDVHDTYRRSRDRLDDQSERCGGSRDRLDDQHDQRDRYGGSRDRLDDRYGDSRGSRDRLDDQRDRGSRDRLDDQRDRGSRDRLDEQRDRGSRDRLDDQRDRYGGSRDHLDNRRDQYGGSRDLDNRGEYSYGQHRN
ncbi:cell surface A33 antigen-like [Embiotoca jacksoni]|uniref:cell surface A33 antigen-like n=1 Tax=Embiotoca jacksoni TaxID=100190 RepID=UPI003704615F